MSSALLKEPFRQIQHTLIVLLLAVTAVHVLITVFTVASYGFQHPFQDQYRLTIRYLTIPFPENILMLENGHRPILPGLVRYVQLIYFQGSHWFEAVLAGAAATGVIAYFLCQCRQCSGGLLTQVTLYAIVSILLWNANARMFIHAHEASHIFYVLLGLTIALEMLWRHLRSGTVGHLLWAVGACFFATFSFGPGFVAFAALFAMAVLLRASIRTLAILVVATAFAFLLYFVLLPGAEAVQKANTGFDLPATVFFGFARIGAAIFELLFYVVREESIRTLIAGGAAAIFTTVTFVDLVVRWKARATLNKLEYLGGGLFFFGLVTNVLIAMQRGGYFLEFPGQLFADRYIFWSCIFWVGMAMYWCMRLAGCRPPKVWLIAVILLVCSLPGIARANYLHAWSAAVFRGVEQAAISLQLGLRDDARVEPMSDLIPGTAYLAADVMRQSRVSLFADTNWNRFGHPIPLVRNEISIGVTISPVNTGSAENAWFASGYLDRNAARKFAGATLWVVSDAGIVRGRCALTGKQFKRGAWRKYFGVPFDLVDCYMLTADSGKSWLVAERQEKFHTLGRLSRQ